MGGGGAGGGSPSRTRHVQQSGAGALPHLALPLRHAAHLAGGGQAGDGGAGPHHRGGHVQQEDPVGERGADRWTARWSGGECGATLPLSPLLATRSLAWLAIILSTCKTE